MSEAFENLGELIQGYKGVYKRPVQFQNLDRMGHCNKASRRSCGRDSSPNKLLAFRHKGNTRLKCWRFIITPPQGAGWVAG